MEMEVDPDKFGGAESGFVDSEANLYQLILACQKVFSSVRESIADIPVQWKELFRSLKDGVYYKFRSEPAVFKAVGGFLFLRFVCPAITAPHAYGLLENPPNSICQRQLVLIGKVIQSLANLQMPGAKETFMQQVRVLGFC
jgi:neurofibromin 1